MCDIPSTLQQPSPQTQVISVENYLEELVDSQIKLAFRECVQKFSVEKKSELNTRRSHLKRFIDRIKNIFWLQKFVLLEAKMTKIFLAVILFWSLVFAVKLALFHANSFPDREAPLPNSFFPTSKSLVVQDFYDGNLEYLEEFNSRSELSIVMLYAPWDARSREFRSSFLFVASMFRNMTSSVNFVAINCHFHSGQCRSRFKLLAFPVIFAQTFYWQSVVFSQALSADRLYSWISSLLFPFEVLNKFEDLQTLVDRTDFTVIGHFEFNSLSPPFPREYNVFVNSAHKIASKEGPSIGFAVVLNKTLAREFGFTSPKHLQFRAFYETNSLHQNEWPLFAIETTSQKSRDILNWIENCSSKYNNKSVYQLELKDAETSSNSEALIQKLNASTYNIVLFTSILGTQHQTRSFALLKNMAKLFHYCPASREESTEGEEGNIPQIGLSSHSSMTSIPIRHYVQICSLSKYEMRPCCDEFFPQAKCKRPFKMSGENKKEDSIESEGGGLRAETSKCAKAFSMLPEYLLQRLCCCSSSSQNAKQQKQQQFFIFAAKHNLNCGFFKLLRKEQQLGSEELTTKIFWGENSKKEKVVSAGNSSSKAFFNFLPNSLNWLVGAGCKLNKTLGFLAVDKRRRFGGGHFLRKWRGGGDVFFNEESVKEEEDTFSLVSRLDERFYWLSSEKEKEKGGGVNLQLLAQFISDFLNSTLQWIPKVEEEKVEIAQFNRQNVLSSKSSFGPSSQKMFERRNFLNKLNFRGFTQKILSNEKRDFDAVVFFSGGGWHGPSRSVLHSFHQVQHFFQAFPQHIQFYIFDTTKNSLPWAYKFERLPVIAFFPAFFPNESHIFPHKLAFTLPNILGFLLPRCKQPLRRQLSISMCSASANCLARNVAALEWALLQKKGAEARLLATTKTTKFWRRGGGGHLKNGRRKSNDGNKLELEIKRLRLQKALLTRLKGLLAGMQQRVRRSAEEDSKTVFTNNNFRTREATKTFELIAWLLERKF